MYYILYLYLNLITFLFLKSKFTYIEIFWGIELRWHLLCLTKIWYEAIWGEVGGECLIMSFFFFFSSAITGRFSFLISCWKSLSAAKNRTDLYFICIYFLSLLRHLQWPFCSDPGHCGSGLLFQHALVLKQMPESHSYLLSSIKANIFSL